MDLTNENDKKGEQLLSGFLDLGLLYMFNSI